MATNNIATIQALKTSVKALHARLSVKWNAEYSEYEVRVLGNANATYFTNDRQDAYDTAVQMATHLQREDVAGEGDTNR
jgi:hypothetical protein